LNYLIDSNIEKYYPLNDIINFIFERNELNDKRIKFILNNKKRNFKISSLLMKELLFYERSPTSDTVFSNLKFYDIEFIMNCCFCYKYKKPLSRSKLKKLISKYEIIIKNRLEDSEFYVSDYLLIACEDENEEFVKFLIKYKYK